MDTDTILSSVATEILKTVVETGGQSISTAIANRFRHSRVTSKKLRDYLERLTNRVSYCVAYRPSPQHIDDVYVEPLILDTALSQSFIKPDEYRKLLPTIIEGASKAYLGASFAAFLAPHLERIEPNVEIKYIPLETLATDHLGVLILGEAGGGKSSLLSRLCLTRLKLKKPRLPILVDAKDLQNDDIASLMREAIASLELEDKDFKWLNNTISLYLDGLDEMSASKYKVICAELSKIRQEMPSLQISVACRSAAYHGELSFLKEVTLVPFDRTRSKDFIRRWFSGVSGGPSANDLISQIEQSEHLADLSSQPLLLALMCNAFRRYLRISRRQTALFDQCINSLLWQWDADRAISRESEFGNLDIEKKKWLHSSLAVRLHKDRKRFCDESFFTNVLQEELPRFGISHTKANEVLDELCVHHGILARWTQDTYGFGHLALQEFLTGRWYADERRWEQLIVREFLTDHWWENVLALCFASLSDATYAMERVLDFKELSELKRMKLLTHCLRFDPIVSDELRKLLLRKVLNWYHNGSAIEKDAALYMLIGIDDDWTSPVIRKSLASKLPTRELAKLLEHARRHIEQ